jgi:hypothetical protein
MKSGSRYAIFDGISDFKWGRGFALMKRISRIDSLQLNIAKTITESIVLADFSNSPTRLQMEVLRNEF